MNRPTFMNGTYGPDTYIMYRHCFHKVVAVDFEAGWFILRRAFSIILDEKRQLAHYTDCYNVKRHTRRIVAKV